VALPSTKLIALLNPSAPTPSHIVVQEVSQLVVSLGATIKLVMILHYL
jgi:hypothetical protein